MPPSSLAAIIGAFAAGLVLARTERRADIATRVAPVADVFVSLFFVIIGVKVEPAALISAGAWSVSGSPRRRS